MLSTNKRDNKNQEIFEGDILYNPISGYEYTVKYGEFELSYTQPFSVKCLGFYIEYEDNGIKHIDSFLMLNLNNVYKISTNNFEIMYDNLKDFYLNINKKNNDCENVNRKKLIKLCKLISESCND